MRDDAWMAATAALTLTKENALPLTFIGLGTIYFLFTYMKRPHSLDPNAHEQWERHVRDAKVALVAGVGAGAILWWLR